MNLREYLQPFSCLFFGFVILSNVVRAQSYESGYILPVGKDTVRGFILNSTDYELLSEISFRGRSVQQPEKFTTNDITGFGFDYGRTFSRLFLKDTVGNSEDSLYLFGKRTVSGKIDLYAVNRKKEKSSDFFLVNRGLQKDAYLTPPEKKTVIDESGNQFVKEDNRFLGLLIYVTQDVSPDRIMQGKKNYSEKLITRSVRNYNDLSREQYPVSSYSPKKRILYTITAGIVPIKDKYADPHSLVFRLTLYREWYFPEKSRKWSYISGLSYRIDRHISHVSSTLEQHSKYQYISATLFGINVHSDLNKSIIPYAYLGAGIYLEIDSYNNYENNQKIKIESSWGMLPTFNAGAGAKFKLGPGYLLAELTPALFLPSHFFLNVGYSF